MIIIFSRIIDFIKKPKRSIRSRIISIFIIIIIILNIVFFLSFIRRDREIEIYQNNVDVNFKLNQLSLQITENSRHFDLLFQERNEENRELYQNSRSEIETLMSEIEPEISRDQKSKTFYRNLSNMLGYHDQLASDLLNSTVLNQSTYQKLTDIDTLYSYMNSHTQNLINSYLAYHSSNYVNLLVDTQNRSKTIYAVVILISVAVFIFAVLMANNILNTIEKLSSSARYLSLGHWEIEDIEEINYRELNILGQTFNLMKKNIRKYIKELKEKSELENKLNQEKMENIEKERLLKESQLLNLQMQMDPHFLFNTLNTVSRTAMFENAAETQNLIIAISKIMRYNLDHKGKLVELKKEIEVLKAYLTIQETRFKEQMDFEINTDGELENIKIPPMIIQPIVENSIIHGLADTDSEGKVLIEIERFEEKVEIRVKDNGVGIKSKKLKEILEEKEQKSNKNKERESLGILNVIKRLKLHYGQNLLRINSIINEGTEVIIEILLGDKTDNN
ncbi:histidine kinase/DNA gyrase B/HSP90-like ATPase [Halanaerobium saccharolyticum]|uniref:Histidine kinase/DNA gyrase B/HSP90-like ATPase n=1 Tax=Halanaerobium saccharolyticum TaxID=43595 RepID=A0A4V3G4Z8_9FIRM|nr:histidine kinase [Halanaerobium saccharolyticum]RAK08995.1 histidine kinase/DNA gyrase B/HSP90-like ATPase [Halanaerobium saccharolyticum]TDW02611.1 histidine kinase/DNA gyrase B/HSP90-like ATPase [Halanaerobium saccharolyticum]TDX60758.1 histidine kinase/DNA gyrase B/HSP90-like ATPase [Halanaerobium saccharolyticum]